MARLDKKKMEKSVAKVTETIRSFGADGISRPLLIMLLRGEGIRLVTLDTIIRENPNIRVSDETVMRDGVEVPVTVYRYVLRDAESLAEASESMGRVVGTIHADKPSAPPTATTGGHPIYELARERLEHRPQADRPQRPPAFDITFRGSGINNPTDMAGWWIDDTSEQWVWE